MNGNFYFRYSKSVPKEYSGGTLAGANLAYVNVPELDPSSDNGNLRIIDRSYHNFPENSILFADTVINYYPGTGNILNDSYNFLITSEYGNARANDGEPLIAINPSIPIRPLWYVYEFGTALPDKAPSGEFSIRIFDDKGNQIPNDHFKINDETGNVPTRLYTDLINTLDINYTLVYMSDRKEVRKLLSVEPLYSRVYTTPVGYQYAIVENPSDNRWLISVPDSGIQYSIKNIGTTKIYTKHPIQVTNQTDPWYLQITNGYFKRILDGNVYEYYLPEYTVQDWRPAANSKQFKLQVLEEPIFIDNQTLRLKQTPLAKYGDSETLKTLHIYVRKSIDRTSETGTDINALVNNKGGLTTLTQFASIIDDDTPDWSQVQWQELEVSDIDRNSGLVKISGLKDIDGNAKDNAIYTTDEIIACYYYIEEEYTVNSINFNPLANRLLLRGGVSVYIRPAKAYGYPGFTTATLNGQFFSYPSVVEWLRFDENEIIVEASAENAPLGITLDEFFTIENNDNVPAEGHDHTKLVELSRIFISPSSTIRDITDDNLIDTRIAGGGLYDPLPIDALAQIQANTYGMYGFRNWNGAVFPGNSIVIIQFPQEKIAGLEATEIEQEMVNLRKICRKHMAAGTLPIVRFYDHTTGQIVDTVLDASGNQVSAHPALDRNFF